jgi:hypothetical protein
MTSRAARSPASTALSMYALQCVAVSVDAQWIGPIGTVRAGPYLVHTCGPWLAL